MVVTMNRKKPEPGSSCSTKRKQPDDDEVLIGEPPIENEYEHLDDDDEDDDDCEESQAKKRAEYERTLEALKSQEPATISQYDDIKITPFNVNEELEEGEFDGADSIDWRAIEKKEREEAGLVKADSQKKANNLEPEPVPDKISCYKRMLRIMRPDETVQKAIRRLGNNVPKRRFNKPISKSHQTEGAATSDSDIAEAKRLLDLMIELTHQRLEDGDTDIYQKLYEDLEEAIN